MARYGWGLGSLAVVAIGVASLSGGGMTNGSDAHRTAGCAVDRATLTAPGCRLVRSDGAARKGLAQLWGELACESRSRHRWAPRGGDGHRTATGSRQRNESYRRLSVLEGDDAFGQRCELGRNEHRFGQRGGAGTFQLYQEGQRKITFVSFRILPDTPLLGNHSQVIMQMKQTQPSDNGGYSPILALNAVGRSWVLIRQDSPGPGQLADSDVLWSARARKGVWTRFAFDVTYSQDADTGRVKLFVDLNGDGDARDSNETSQTVRTPTLKYETQDPAGQRFDVDGVAPGESIPSHLRIGLYQDQAYSCLGVARSRCSIAVDNVQVVAPREQSRHR